MKHYKLFSLKGFYLAGLVAALFISVPIILGCGQPLVFVGINTEPIALFTENSPDKILPIEWGESYHGGIMPGDVLSLHSDIGENHILEVYDPTIGNYISISGSTSNQSATDIRDYYLELEPSIGLSQRRMAASWISADTRYPVYTIVTPSAFPLYVAPFTLLRVHIKGIVPSNVITNVPAGYNAYNLPTIRVVDATTGLEVWHIEENGRVAYVRIGTLSDANGANVVDIHGMSHIPTSPNKITGYPTITIETDDVPENSLGYVVAALYPEDPTRPGCYLNNPIGVKTSNIVREVVSPTDVPTVCPNATSSCEHWTYTFQPVSALTPGTAYALVIGVNDLHYFGNIPPNYDRLVKLTQDMSGVVIADTLNYPIGPIDIGNVWCQYATGMMVYPYYFIDPGSNGSVPPMPLPAIPVVNIHASVKIKPEVMKQNDGVFTAFVSFPDGSDVSTIQDASCSGATATKIIYSCSDQDDTDDTPGLGFTTDASTLTCNKKFAIMKFKRSDITYPGTSFICWGHTTDGKLWAGYDMIKQYIP
ncbi:MAG: hypothetical protein ACP5JP_08070 [bacterium]